MLFALGFLFLFTVGGLKILLALPLKITICWKLLTIILLILIVKMYYFEQSAGNQNILSNILVGSSETTRNLHNKFIMKRYSPLNNSLKRFYSTNNKNIINEPEFINLEGKHIKPLIMYNSLKNDKLDLFKYLKNKSGIYCLYNNINGNSYIGSTINLNSRIKNYLNKTYLKNKNNNNIPIIKDLLKYEPINFSILILEFVKPEYLNIRETYYITLIKPYYNILKQGYSSLGDILTKETKSLLTELANNKVHNELTKSLISKALVGENNPFYNNNYSTETKIRVIESKTLYPIYIYDSYKKLLVIFPSILTFSKKVNSNSLIIVKYIKDQNLFRGEWYITNIPYNISDKPSINNWNNKDSEELILDIINSDNIKKAIFVYNINKEFLYKYDGVTKAQKSLNINHSIIKKYAELTGTYNNYIFSYHRLDQD